MECSFPNNFANGIQQQEFCCSFRKQDLHRKRSVVRIGVNPKPIIFAFLLHTFRTTTCSTAAAWITNSLATWPATVKPQDGVHLHPQFSVYAVHLVVHVNHQLVDARV